MRNVPNKLLKSSRIVGSTTFERTESLEAVKKIIVEKNLY